MIRVTWVQMAGRARRAVTMPQLSQGQDFCVPTCPQTGALRVMGKAWFRPLALEAAEPFPDHKFRWGRICALVNLPLFVSHVESQGDWWKMGFLPDRKWPGGPSGWVLPFWGGGIRQVGSYIPLAWPWAWGLCRCPRWMGRRSGFFLTLWADAVHLSQGF